MSTFTDFWNLYPRRVARRAAEQAWDKSIKRGNTPDEIIAGLKLNLAYLESRQMEFRPHPATWINQDRHTDEPQVIAIPERKRNIADAARDRISNSNDDFGVRWLQH